MLDWLRYHPEKWFFMVRDFPGSTKGDQYIVAEVEVSAGLQELDLHTSATLRPAADGHRPSLES